MAAIEVAAGEGTLATGRPPVVGATSGWGHLAITAALSASPPWRVPRRSAPCAVGYRCGNEVTCALAFLL